MSQSESQQTPAHFPGTPERSVRLSRLTEREREIYVSVEEEGLRPADLAQYVDLEKSTIRTYLARARQKVGESQQ